MSFKSVPFLLLLFSQSGVFARDVHNTDTVLVVDTVMIVGNSHTRSFVILREMSLRPGMPATRESMEYERDRIYSLGLFNRVQLHLLPTIPGKAALVVEVNERWYIFPFPVFGLRDRDWDKLYYGAGILHSNFRGRNEKLFGMVILGYDPAVEASYRNPFLSGDGKYLGEARTAYQKVRNRSIEGKTTADNFDEYHVSAALSLGRRFGTRHTVWTTLGYEIVEISEYRPGRSISEEGKDRYPFFGLSYTYDTRDLYEYPSMGTFIRFSMRKYGLPGRSPDIVRYGSDLRKYLPLFSKFVLTGRLFTDNTAAGPTPAYNRVYLGYGERIRGHFSEVREGENLFGVSAEMHYPLLDPIYIYIDFLPSEFGILRFGIVAAAFADAGTVWFRKEPFALNTFSRGYGAGVHFLLPYSMVLRTDYAWNESRRGEFIVDLGKSF